MSSPVVANQGPPVRAVVDLSALILLSDDIKVFDLEDLKIDWGAFTAGQGYTFLVRPTDNISVGLNNQQPSLLVILTDAPVQVNFTDALGARSAIISPPVQPANWFTTQHSPSEQPKDIQPGLMILTGNAILTLALVGLASSTVSANVRVGVAGYQQ